MKFRTVMLAAGVCGALIGAENLVKNGDFSAGNQNWKSAQYRGGKPFHTFADGKLIVSGNAASRNNNFATLIQPLPKLEAGKTYLLTATADAKIASPVRKSVWIKIRQVSPDNRTLSYNGIDVGLRDVGPKQYSAWLQPSEKAASFVFYVTGINLADDDTVTVSDIRLVPIDVPQDVPGNMVKNGNFTAPTLKPWSINARKVKNAPFAVSVDPDTGVATIKVSGDPENKQKAFMTMVQPLPQLEQGRRYRISAKIKAGIAAARGKSVGSLVRQINAENKSICYEGISIPLAREGWVDYGRDFTPNAKAVKYQLYITNCNLGDGETVQIRDVVLVPAE